MNTLWKQVMALEGRTLRTAALGEPIMVASVTARNLFVVPASSGMRCMIQRAQLEAVDDYARQGGEMTMATVQQAGAPDANPAYVMAILAAARQAEQAE